LFEIDMLEQNYEMWTLVAVITSTFVHVHVQNVLLLIKIVVKRHYLLLDHVDAFHNQLTIGQDACKL